MKLYSAALSPNGKRIRLCATELGLAPALEEVTLDLARGDNRAADYLALNPMGKWPTLVDGDLVLWESGAILTYLASKKPDHPLFPSARRPQAEVLRWMFFTSCHVDPYFTQLVVERSVKARRSLPADDHAAAVAEGWLARFLPNVEAHLGTHDYLAGRAFTIADIALGTTLELGPLVTFDLAAYPNLQRWLGRLVERPTWRLADAPLKV